jgi:two-component system phosphate regulon sensor histidine kinase PhoR
MRCDQEDGKAPGDSTSHGQLRHVVAAEHTLARGEPMNDSLARPRADDPGPASRVARAARGVVERASALPLRWQIGTLVVLGLIGIFTLFGLLGAAIANDAKERTMNGWLAVTHSAADSIDSELAAEYQRLESVAAHASAVASDPARERQVVADALWDDGSLVSAAMLLDASGRVVWSTWSDPNTAVAYVAGHPGILGPLTTAARYASGVEAIDQHASVVLAVPVLADGHQTIGVLAVLLRPDRGPIRDLVESARGLAHSGHAELVDQNDRVVISSEADRPLGPGEHPDFYDPLMAEHRSAVGLTAPVTGLDPADAGQRHDMAFVPLRTVPWALALGGSDTELSADSNRWQSQILLFGSLSIVVALLLVWLTTRSVARPILALAAASRQIAAGDLSTPIPHGGEGEVRLLAQAFDHMRGELQTALSDLALEKSRYEGIVTSMADAVVTTGTDMRVTAFNPAASALTGWSVAEAVGRPSAEVIGDSAQPEPGQSKALLQRRDGSEVNVSTTRSSIHDQTGLVAGTVHVLRDVSAEAEVDRLKDEFLSTVSHELRTPLGFIMGYATSLLLPDATDDRNMIRKCVRVIADASNELKELVDNLLDMTKIGAGTLSVAPVPTRLGPLLYATVERIRGRGTPHHFAIAVPASLPAVRADAHRIEQVLYNLLDNAIRYSPDGGRIAVRAAAGVGDVMVSVLDEGVGIRADELSSVFERFHRGSTARARGIGGTGLGLAICRGIVEAHGGRIWAESPPVRPGKPRGTAIRFTLPVAELAGGDA